MSALSMQSSRRRLLLFALPEAIWPAALICLIGVFLVLKLRAGLDWDGDDALYVMNAQNILRGSPYGDTPYLFNAANAINPAAYPPGLPLLFAPVLHVQGLDLYALRIECIVALLLFLGVLWALARDVVGPLSAMLIVAAMGLQPFIIESTNTPASEFPFLLFCYGSLLVLERLYLSIENRTKRTPLWTVLAAMTVSAACLTRSVGILLFPAALAAAWWRGRAALVRTTVALVGAAAVCLAVQSVYRADVGTYFHYFDQFNARDLITNVVQYRHVAETLLGTSRSAVWLCRLMLLIAALGYLSRVRALSVLECFFALYLMLLIVYPVSLEPARYEMPVWPLLFIYVARGLAIVKRFMTPQIRPLVGAALLLVLAFLYAVQLRQLDFGPFPYSITARQSSELFAAVRALPPDARLLARKPTILALFTGHKASIWPEHFSDPQLAEFMRQLRITYIVQDLPHLGVNPRAPEELDPFICRNRSALDLVFSNAWFNLYRVRTTAGEGGKRDRNSCLFKNVDQVVVPARVSSE